MEYSRVMLKPPRSPPAPRQIFESLENVTGAVVYCGHAIDPNHGDQQVSDERIN